MGGGGEVVMQRAVMKGRGVGTELYTTAQWVLPIGGRGGRGKELL